MVDEEDCAVKLFIEGETTMSLDTLQSSLMAKVTEVSLEDGQKSASFSLLTQFDNMSDGHGHSSLTEHVINIGDAKPNNILPYHMPLLMSHLNFWQEVSSSQ